MPTWNDIVGHEHAVGFLKQVATSNRLAHAYLFSGSRGVGKASAAQVFAAQLLCAAATPPCGACSACQKVFAANHPDYFLIDGTETITIDRIRELVAKLQFHPLEGKRKVVVIDPADAMTEAAQNALLKTLEEPPLETHFILISHALHKLAATLRSRCQIIPFTPLVEETIVALLFQKAGIQKSEAVQRARIAQGSVGIALNLDGTLVESVTTRIETLLKTKDPVDILATAEEWSQEAENPSELLNILLCHYRNRFTDPTQRFSETEKGMGAIFAATEALETTVNKQLMFERLLFTLVS